MVIPLLVWMVLTRPPRSKFALVPALVSTLVFLPLALKLCVVPFGLTFEVPPAGCEAAVLPAVPPLAPATAPAFALAAAPAFASVAFPGLPPAPAVLPTLPPAAAAPGLPPAVAAPGFPPAVVAPD